MNYYVKVVDGEVKGLPQVLSPYNSDTPNANWSIDQMRLNGFFIVYLDFDPKTQKVDYDNPIVSEESVVYPILDKTEEELLEDYTREYKDLRKKEYIEKGLTEESLIIALWEKVLEGKDSLANEIQTKRLEVKEKYPKP